jgi:hypothetical protein
VNIKVDREERPDLDSIYMRAVQVLTGHGGWPLTAFLTPDGRAFFGGTYFPPEPRHGMPSFRQVLTSVSDAYRNRREDVEKGSRAAPGGPQGTRFRRGGAFPWPWRHRRIGRSILEHAVRFLAGRFDPVHGGFGPAPKFPQPMTLEILLRQFHRTGDGEALDMALRTLRSMARGGIRDHLGGGFHRYSVDGRWLVPHFEKMLYDNGLLARVYLHAFQITGTRSSGTLRRPPWTTSWKTCGGPKEASIQPGTPIPRGRKASSTSGALRRWTTSWVRRREPSSGGPTTSARRGTSRGATSSTFPVAWTPWPRRKASPWRSWRTAYQDPGRP